MPSENASSSCFRCRTKRTKVNIVAGLGTLLTSRQCDRKWPSCTQCIRTGSSCQGYKDAWSQNLRDQTQKIHRKYTPSTTPSENAAIALSIRSFDAVNRALPMEMALYHMEPALQSFFCNYVQNNGHGSDTSLYGYDEIPRMLASSSADCPLKMSVVCLGMASLSKRNSADNDVRNALDTTYSRALRTTNKALQDPTLQTSDEVFMSILLLGIFEVITLCSINVLRINKAAKQEGRQAHV